MRFVTRILTAAGATAAATALALPATATAATAAPASSTAAARLPIVATSWGPYYSADHRSKAVGKVFVKTEMVRAPSGKRWSTWEKKCINHHGHKVGKPVREWHKKRVWKLVRRDEVTITSVLSNRSWRHRGFECAWETLRIRRDNGRVFTRSFHNCGHHSKTFSYTVRDASKVWVSVSRGDSHRARGSFSGWHSIYPV
jgi:hypothetical protein